ncbi:uncharacterized protein E5676_scaffold1784G00010 [Cucumis melo var. makuwa]|uniref:Ulp1-like peptidase n=1 Tax=Cucumis melo var. makuwa TaxID=1194695 RepID=A0A5A7T852_CUCMM|nr:uncharacterized protein E6C27_scaffold471G00010 [Cucumis melo var. makuwa]TYK27294.1 uncharacterized protein E5676_scaffold1784G00010 [Cucumis melo var. makuwa]
MPCGLEERKGVKEDYKKLEDIKRGTCPIEAEYTWVKDAIILKYVNEKLIDYDKAWMDVDYIYIPTTSRDVTGFWSCLERRIMV